MTTKLIKQVVLGAAVALASQAAFAASTIVTKYKGAAYGYSTGKITPNPYANSGTTVSIGAFKMRNTLNIDYEFVDKANDSNANIADEFVAWCVDPTHWLVTSTTATYNVGGKTELTSAFNSTRANNLQALANQRYSLLSDNVNNTVESAAFQLATWTILFGSDGTDADTILDFEYNKGSTFQAWDLNSSVSSMANLWLSQLGSAQATGNYKIHYLYDQLGRAGTNQDLVTFTVNPVPLPAAAWLFGSALLGFVGWTRRKSAGF